MNIRASQANPTDIKILSKSPWTMQKVKSKKQPKYIKIWHKMTANTWIFKSESTLIFWS
jgi:hypothetical protein